MHIPARSANRGFQGCIINLDFSIHLIHKHLIKILGKESNSAIVTQGHFSDTI